MDRSRRRIRELWLGVATVAVLAVTGCSKGEGTTGPSTPATPVGTYTMLTIDTKALPYTMFAETGYTLEVTSGALSVTSAGKWVSKVITRETVAGNVSTYSDSTFGTWTVPSGSKVAVFVNAETQVASNATWTSTDVTVNDVDGATTRAIVYRRN